MMTIDKVNARVEESLLANGTSAGWKFVYGLHPFTIDVNGAFSGTVTVYVSNGASPALAAPTDADANHSVLGTKTAAGSILSDGPYKFVKVTGPSGANAALMAANAVAR